MCFACKFKVRRAAKQRRAEDEELYSGMDSELSSVSLNDGPIGLITSPKSPHNAGANPLSLLAKDKAKSGNGTPIRKGNIHHMRRESLHKLYNTAMAPRKGSNLMNVTEADENCPTIVEGTCLVTLPTAAATLTCIRR
ncbi:hypothetical protein CYMTET_55512 [Cymbomonas tetramitiformis]|uniref:Uncharacterized protein n=1 Tax=Cymbomonas tetramitiformis TaxID=36881 RepID=A0AAE0ENI5_9CHLO|nr:hypothetical protein CYMTET_55512 [Cymbomonas tetramitiformis]